MISLTAVKRSSWVRSGISGLQPILLAGLGFALAWLLPVPVARSIGGWVRHGFDSWLVGFLFVLFYMLARLESIYVPGILAGGIAGVMGLALVGLWTHVYSEMQVVSGMLFFSDAYQYYTDALRLLNGFLISPFSARHPLPTVFLAVLLALSDGRLQLALAITVFLVGIGVYFCARDVLYRYGAAAAAVLVVLIYFFYRRFIGFPDSENLGILLGCLAFVFLCRGLATSSGGQFLVGFFFLSLALSARPGPLAALPLAALVSPIQVGKGKRAPVVFKLIPGMLIIGVVIGMNILIVRAFAEQRSRLFSNFAYTFYGVVQGGGGWERFLQDYPEYQALSGPEAEKLACDYAWESLKENPSQAIRGVLSAYRDFFSLADKSVFGFLAGGELVSFNRQVEGNEKLFWLFTRLAASLLSIFGLAYLYQQRTLPVNILYLLILLGIILSVPFLPPRDAGMMRFYAAVVPFLALLPGLVLVRVFKIKVESTGPKKYSFDLVGASALLVVWLAVGSLGLYTFRKTPGQAPVLNCAGGGTPIRFRVYPASYVSIREDQEIPFTRLPEVRISGFRASLVSFHRRDLVQYLSEIPAGHMALNTVNLLNGQPLWVILPDLFNDLLPAGETLSACGHWHAELLQQGLGFLIVDEAVMEGKVR